MPILKIYDEDKELILVSQEFQGYKGWGLLTDLLPNTTYEEGTYFVSWEDKDFESEKIPVPRFTTESNTNKELVFYFKDALTVEPMTAYDIAVRNGFTGTEEEWVKSIKGEPGDSGLNLTQGGSAYEYALDNGFEGTAEEWLKSLKGDKGESGKPFTFKDLTEEQLKELKGTQGEPGKDGKDGKSSYELAVEEGFQGGIDEYLDSLHGEKGEPLRFTDLTDEQIQSLKGKDGTMTFEELTEEQKQSLKGDRGEKGDNGESAYDLAVDKGFQGSITEFLESLKGENGDTGLQGEKGDTGLQGDKGDTGLQGERGDTGATGDRGKDSSQRNFSEMKIATELPRYFKNYDSIKVSSGNDYYYPQGLAVTQNYYFLTFQPTKKADGEGDGRRILVAYDKNGEEITKFLIGGFGGESIHVEENNNQVIIYYPTGTSDIGKSTITVSPSNYTDFSEIPDLIPTNVYKVNLLYQFSKVSNGWIVELNTTSKGTYKQRDLFAFYDDDFNNIKKYIAISSSNSTLWDSPLVNKSIKRQGFTVYKNEMLQIVGGNTYNDDEETNYSNQGVQILSPEGRIVRDYTYSIKEFNEYITSTNRETQRIEHEGLFVYDDDDVYSCIVYNTKWAYTGKGVLIVKYGSKEEPDYEFSKGGIVSTAVSGDTYNLTPVGTLVANMYTGELMDNMEDIIKYMLATYQEKGYLYTSKVKIKDFDSSVVMPGGIFIDITNLNNRTFWVVYKSLGEKKEKHVTFEWSTNKFIYNTPSW